ncbi:MAG: MoxR family ATPase [Planctomycetaceae bacterium]|nr:MoxR family ATPase [Planctomycetaceae bacterium]
MVPHETSPSSSAPAKPAEKPALRNEDAAVVAQLRNAYAKVKEQVAKVIVGQQEIVEHLLIGLLCRGHVLLLGVPGLGKTLMARTLARTLNLEFRRVQFTPDLMPSDITGTDVIEEDPETHRHRMDFMPGPIFTNFLLADEINRTPPKTQAALLQAMQEQEVSVGQKTHQLSLPFYVVATQNPIEMEGTYPLPEAQLDRFMFNVRVKYPSIDEEVQIVKGTTGTVTGEAASVLSAEQLLRLQELVRGVPVADDVIRYAAQLVAASRPEVSREVDKIHKYIAYGASPRASQYLVLGGKGRAILAGRYHVDFADIQALAAPVLRHRIVLNFHARADGVDSDEIVRRLIQAVPHNGRPTSK